jgi:hypothetical protein
MATEGKKQKTKGKAGKGGKEKTTKTYRIISEEKEIKDNYADVANKLANLAYGKPLSECLGHKETVKTCKNSLAGNRITVSLPKGNTDFKTSGYIHSIVSHLNKHGAFAKIVYTE